MRLSRVLAVLLLGSTASTAVFASAFAGEVNVAVAANFTDAAKEVAAAFKEETGDDAVLSFGSTGKLYTQITQDAPFEVFLAADQARPEKAETEGFGVKGSRFTYAVGKLVLWSKDGSRVVDADTLKKADFAALSICNPVAAPYGAAAVETMTSLGLYDGLKPKLVEGANISQAYQFVETGNAEVGFVALSQLAGKTEGASWVVPQDLYKPIRQDAVLLKTGADNEAAKAFMTFLGGPKAHEIIAKYGYGFDAGS